METLKQPGRQREGKRRFLKMTLQPLKRLRDYSNSFNLSNVAEQFRS